MHDNERCENCGAMFHETYCDCSFKCAVCDVWYPDAGGTYGVCEMCIQLETERIFNISNDGKAFMKSLLHEQRLLLYRSVAYFVAEGGVVEDARV